MKQIVIALYAIILLMEGGRYFWPYIFRGDLATLNLDLVILSILAIATIIFFVDQVATHEKTK